MENGGSSYDIQENINIYIDGHLIKSCKYVLSRPFNIAPNGLWIGGDQECVGGCWEELQQFSGALDEFYIYNRALSEEEISAIYNKYGSQAPQTSPGSFPTDTTTTYNNKKPPVAIAGDDVTVYEGSKVVLSALSSYDPDGQIVNYQWSENGVTISTSPVFSHIFPVGDHAVVLKITDNDGLTSTDIVNIKVLSKEANEPAIIVSQSALTAKEGLFTVTIANVGDGDAYEVYITERVPSGISISYVSGANSAGSLIMWSGDLKAGEIHTIEHSLKLISNEAIIPVTVKYKDAQGRNNEIHTNLYITPDNNIQSIKPPISEQTLIVVVSLLLVAIIAIAYSRRRPPRIEIRE